MANTGALRSLYLWNNPRQRKYPPLLIPGLSACFFKGLERGTLVEVNGRPSSGRSSFANHVLAQATAQGEICAVVDLDNHFAPHSAARAGVELSRIIWTRCGGNTGYAMRAVDLLLHAGGFGVVFLDLCNATPRMLNRIPLSYWYRFRRAVEDTATILLIAAEHRQAKSCCAHTLELQISKPCWSGLTPFRILRGIEVKVTLKASAAPPHSASLRTVM